MIGLLIFLVFALVASVAGLRDQWLQNQRRAKVVESLSRTIEKLVDEKHDLEAQNVMLSNALREQFKAPQTATQTQQTKQRKRVELPTETRLRARQPRQSKQGRW